MFCGVGVCTVYVCMCVCPQADVPTAIGVGPPGEVAMETESGSVAQLEKKYYIDSTYITVPREGVEINTPLRDGLGVCVCVCVCACACACACACVCGMHAACCVVITGLWND